MLSRLKSLTSPSGYGVDYGKWRILEAFSGAWQRNIEWKRCDVTCFPTVFACITLLASDVSKLPVNVVRRGQDDIWRKISFNGYEVLKKPNDYQTRIQFFETWVNSKLIRGNTYVFKERDNRGKVIGLHVLHPDRVLPLVSDDGQVFYQLSQDNLAGLDPLGITVPASEIIHDRFNCLWHPLVGLSPIYAAGLAAHLGLKMLENTAKLFENGARPSGILTVPEAISPEHAQSLSDQWNNTYGGENYGKVAIMGGDMKYVPLTMRADEAQLIEQLRMTAELICSTFHVPPYKVGIGATPSYNNVQALNVEYYSSGVQSLIEAIELCLDEGLRFEDGSGTEFELDALLRMDTKSMVDTLGAGVDKAIFAPNEARLRMNLPPIEGGDVPFLQHQMYPITLLASRTTADNTSSAVTVNTQSQTEEVKWGELPDMLRKELLNA